MIKFQGEYRSRNNDFSQTVVNWIIWGAIEPSTSIMAACFPTLAPVLLPSFRRNSSYHQHRKQSYSMQWGSRGIHTETSVHVKHRAMDSMEHFAHDTGLAGDGAGTFGTLTEVEAGGGAIPKALLVYSQGERGREGEEEEEEGA